MASPLQYPCNMWVTTESRRKYWSAELKIKQMLKGQGTDTSTLQRLRAARLNARNYIQHNVYNLLFFVIRYSRLNSHLKQILTSLFFLVYTINQINV